MSQKVPDQLAQSSYLLIAKDIHSPRRVVLAKVSCLLRSEETSLTQASWLLAWMNGTLKY